MFSCVTEFHSLCGGGSESDPPAVVDGEHLFLQDLLRHDAVEHRRDAVDGHVGVTHPQDAVELGEDEGHGGQRRGLGEHLHHGDPAHLRRRTR